MFRKVVRAFTLTSVTCLVLGVPATASAQKMEMSGGGNRCVSIPQMDEQTANVRKQATALFGQMKYQDAIPLFEKVLAVVPKDVVAQERLAQSVLHYADSLSDPGQRKAARIRARKEFLRAKELGDDSDLLQSILFALPEDGRDTTYSESPEVDRLVKQGETAFSGGKLDEARAAYLEALKLDPHLYIALLFVGDVHFRKGEYDKAGEWFLHATQMEPLRETAYRYWGDALLKQSSYAAAREKFIDAVICDPYNPRVWSGVNGFLRAVGKPAVFRRVTPPPLKLVKTGESSYTLQVPRDMPKDDGSLAWIGYPTIQPAWRGGKFAQEYPQEKEYRHSLKEESVALSIVAEVAMGMQAKGQKLNDGLEFLISLRQKGLLEPYILINAADQGIAKDYAEYRRSHRDLLVRYLSEVVLPAAPESAVEQNRK